MENTQDKKLYCPICAEEMTDTGTGEYLCGNLTCPGFVSATDAVFARARPYDVLGASVEELMAGPYINPDARGGSHNGKSRRKKRPAKYERLDDLRPPEAGTWLSENQETVSVRLQPALKQLASEMSSRLGVKFSAVFRAALVAMLVRVNAAVAECRHCSFPLLEGESVCPRCHDLENCKNP